LNLGPIVVCEFAGPEPRHVHRHVAWIACGHDRLNFSRHGNTDQAGATTQRTAATQDSGTRHTAAAGDNQHKPKVAFMGIAFAPRESR
jgi:hypothetical protein